MFSSDLSNSLNLPKIKLSDYVSVFLKKNDSLDSFITMFLNIIQDFIDKKISEEEVSNLIQESLFNEKTKKYHYDPYLKIINDLLSVVHQLLDVTWAKKSPHYSEYLAELNSNLKLLKQKYS